ncbi:hypothetical protein PISMIDRAFT_493155 [Pisolithus microcarpus 441]|uniref:Uncharacterized protein n=1 Tax=Pisolithus microcarpus 441 TaxID=765257 RepID=A0A0C9ZJQ0_9AGAM|nr:hypothetical protein PISMIDRAFT_493155 [Pisolithus microcarpus 441]
MNLIKRCSRAWDAELSALDVPPKAVHSSILLTKLRRRSLILSSVLDLSRFFRLCAYITRV